MKNLLNTLATFIDHERGVVVAIVLSLCLVGCAWLTPKAPSPVDGKLISRVELDGVVAAFDAKAQAAYKMIEAQEFIGAKVLEMVTSAASSVPGPWGGIIGAVGGILATGVGADNVRKNGIIKQHKAKLKAQP